MAWVGTNSPRTSFLSLAAYLRHPLAVFGLQALLGFLEVGVLVVVSGRLQVVVDGVGGAGRCCGNCEETKATQEEKKEINETRNLRAGPLCCIIGLRSGNTQAERNQEA